MQVIYKKCFMDFSYNGWLTETFVFAGFKNWFWSNRPKQQNTGKEIIYSCNLDVNVDVANDCLKISPFPMLIW